MNSGALMPNLPATMRVIDVPEPGGPAALTVSERKVPTPADGEVLISVAAAGVNRADVLQRRGGYPPPPGAPDWPGLEVAGTVAAVGRGVREFSTGDAVCALLQGGGYAEYCVAAVGQCLPIPAGLDMAEAASLPEACFTVWSNVFEVARLGPGESLLVHGGSSGIGVIAIQLASALGNQVFATAGTDEKCRFCERLGAIRAVNYHDEDFVAALKEPTAGRGVDVILDMVAGDYLARNLELLAPEGRVIVIATMGGSQTQIDLRQVMTKRLIITGSTLRPRSVSFKSRIKARLLERVWPLIESGAVRPIIDRQLSLTEAAEAHAYMESSAHKGKIILTVP